MQINYFSRKLYALISDVDTPQSGNSIASELRCLQNDDTSLRDWWDREDTGSGKQAQDIAASSDRVNLHHLENQEKQQTITAKHPISGQSQQVRTLGVTVDIPSEIKDETDPEKVFWWFWRFYPEKLAQKQTDALLFPAHKVIPDCPQHSYQSTVSALTGAMFPKSWESGDEDERPYLLIFSFSPVQEFIKSSRKFLDFWAGSYLLHYLSVQLCWSLAQELGPDAIIVPSLWSQEIIDALILKKYPDFAAYLQENPPERNYCELNPVANKFEDKTSTSLSTAGFPNVITVLVPGKKAAKEWGENLSDKLKNTWVEIGNKVRKDIRTKVIDSLKKCDETELLKEAFPHLFPKEGQERSPEELAELEEKLKPYRKELNKIKTQSCWEWKYIWEAQLDHTWEPYWAAVPLGNPEQQDLLVSRNSNLEFFQNWINAQQEIAKSSVEIPSKVEKQVYKTLNVGTWWGSLQKHLGLCLSFVKNTRNWQIPAAPGERSTISGQFSAIHPCLNYQEINRNNNRGLRDLREGAGLPQSSMRLFWLVMSKAYPGLFNGTEKLNALEITKRMAWVYGGVAEELGINIKKLVKESTFRLEDITTSDIDQEILDSEPETIIDYEQLIRFPNLSSIAVARFAHESPEILEQYWKNLNELIRDDSWEKPVKKENQKFSKQQKRAFYSKTQRPSHIQKTDKEIKDKLPDLKKGYNGVMFSGKWLADDMGLEGDKIGELKDLIQKAHKKTDLFNGSPADWWVILLADGDGMGGYVTGEKLEKYGSYIVENVVDKNVEGFQETEFNELLQTVDKRMGPATHVGLNRALLDFSNRLVPYLTEKRFCGRVIYSGGDDVKAVLPLEDLPEYLLSLRAAWCGNQDPHQDRDFTTHSNGISSNGISGNGTSSNGKNQQQTIDQHTGYWHPNDGVEGLPKRPHFTMGEGATMSMGVIIAHKSVPLPTVLENLWEAESDRAKKMPGKDGICFRIIYSGGNKLEALMKGELLETWWEWVKEYPTYGEDLSPLLHRLAEELPQRAYITKNYKLFSKAAEVIMNRREQELEEVFEKKIKTWLDAWEEWVIEVKAKKVLIFAISLLIKSGLCQFVLQLQKGEKEGELENEKALGTKPEDLGNILKFTAFWIDKRVQRHFWKVKSKKEKVKI